MAAEAVLKIQAAEEAGGELIKNAQLEAREIAKRAEADGAARKLAIIGDARKKRTEMIAASEAEARAKCKSMESESAGELAKMRSPDSKRFTEAVALVTERIVS